MYRAQNFQTTKYFLQKQVKCKHNFTKIIFHLRRQTNFLFNSDIKSIRILDYCKHTRLAIHRFPDRCANAVSFCKIGLK